MINNTDIIFEFISKNEKHDLLSYEFNNNSEHYSKNLIENEFQISFSKIIIGKFKNIVIASSIIWEIDENIELHHIHVMDKFRRSGIGSKLLMFIFDYALKNKKSGIFLEVKESNIAAVNLYIKMGFSKIRIRESYYKDGTNALEMYKKLL